MKIKEATIKAIFTNLIFVIGIILTVIGFIRGSNTVVKMAVFDKYPLNGYEESRCENDLYVARPVLEEVEKQELPEEEKQEKLEKCLESLEKDRQLRMVEDITNSISFFIAGAFLTFTFRRFIFNKEK